MNWNYRPRAGIQARQQDFPLAAIYPGACFVREPDSDDERRIHPHKAKAPPKRGLCRRLSRLLLAAREAETGEAEATGSGHKVLDGTGDERLVGVSQRGNTRFDVDRHARDIVRQRNEAPPRTSTGSLGPVVAQSLYVRLRFPRYAIIAGPMIPLHGRGLIAAPVPFAGY